MEKLNFLRELRKRQPSLVDLKIVGGPVPIDLRVHVDFMPEVQTTLRSIEWRKSEDGSVHAVVWRVGKSVFNKLFKDEREAGAFYHGKMRELRYESEAEAAEIRRRLEKEFEESWRGAGTVWRGRGFKIQVFYRETDYEELCVINPKMPGLIRFTCPNCKAERILDARQSFNNFKEKVEDEIASFDVEPPVPSYVGRIVGRSLPAGKCQGCRRYFDVDFEAQIAERVWKPKVRRIGEVR